MSKARSPILGQDIPLGPGTSCFDETGAPRTEERFFRIPGDVMIGDIVRAKDQSATDFSILDEADEV